MGTQQSLQRPVPLNPIAAGFTRAESISGTTTWVNNQTKEELEEHQFVYSNER